MNTTTTTAAKVRNTLPLVMIDWNGTKYWATVTGPRKHFATVTPCMLATSTKYSRKPIGPAIHYTWDQVAEAINTETPLKMNTLPITR